MRIALFADVHGNSIALDAVLADIREQGGADAYWALGDLVAVGPDPVGVLERIAALPEVRCTRGNQERYLVTGERPKPTLERALDDPCLWPVFVEVMQSFAWTLGALATSGWWDWLAALPLSTAGDSPFTSSCPMGRGSWAFTPIPAATATRASIPRRVRTCCARW